MAKSEKKTRTKGRKRSPSPPVVTYVEGEMLVQNKATGFAYFNLPDERGIKKRYYQGRFDDTVTLDRAARFIREYRVAGGPPQDKMALSVRQLADRYVAFALGHYGETSQVEWIYQPALDFLCERYGDVLAGEFGPLKLLAVRDAMVESGRWIRSGVNARLAILKRAFRWAASRELVPASVPQALDTVENIARGRTKAREGSKVKPVPETYVKAVVAGLCPIVAAMVEVQRLTGCRPGELAIMRPMDIERDDKIWLYRPSSHKTENHGRELIVPIGPKAQKVLGPFLLGRDAESFCFSPREAEVARRAELREQRVTAPNQGNAPGTNRRREPKVTPGDHYTTGSYRRAVHRACDKAGVGRWSPHQLRHTRATELRRKYGIEATRIALGHANAGITEIYAEADLEIALKIAEEVG